jgi:hypothetical protein
LKRLAGSGAGLPRTSGAFLFTNVTDAAGRRCDIPVALGHRYSVGTA